MNHIEFLGIAGSGKSTVRSILCHRNDCFEHILAVHRETVADTIFPTPLVPVGRRLPSIVINHLCRISGLSDRGVNYFQMNHPTMLETAGLSLHEYTHDPTRRDNVSRRLLTLIERFGIISEYGTYDDTLLLDEGFAFSAGSVMHPPTSHGFPREDDLDEYLSVIPVPEVIIHLRISPETCITRINARKKGPPNSWEELNRAERKQQAIDAARVSDIIAEKLVDRGTTVIDLETENTSIGKTVRLAETKLLEVGALEE